MVSTYAEFQDEVSSEKVVLAQIDASKRLIGWVLDSGTIYKLTSFDFSVIVSIEDSGTDYTEVTTKAAVGPSKFFNDKTNNTLFLESTDSSNPNGRFLALKFRSFFANVPVTAANDLASGFEVYWQPMILSTSKFNQRLDNQNQFGNAIEGKGTITLINDHGSLFDWPSNFDTLFFENHGVSIFSWERTLPITEAKLLFKGKITGKSYSERQIQFQLADIIGELRSQIDLTDMGDLAGARITDDLIIAKQRRIYGKLFGNRPTNIDQVKDGFPITGTVSITNGTTTLTGVSTVFFKEFSPDDRIKIGADTVEFTISSITSDTSLEITEAYSEGNKSASTAVIIPALSKSFTNRIFKIAGHALREPTTTVSAVNSFSQIVLTDGTDFETDDEIFVGAAGSGEVTEIKNINSGALVNLKFTLVSFPSIGTSVKKPAVSNIRINDILLRFDRDYTVDATAGTLTLKETAEFNTSPVREVVGTITLTASSRTVTGSGSAFKAQLQPGFFIRKKGLFDFFEISSIESDTSLTLKTLVDAPNAGSGVSGQYKPVIPFIQGQDVLSCDVLGATADGTKDGAFLKTGPQVVKDLLSLAGLTTDIDAASFTTAQVFAPYVIGFAIPEKFNDTRTPKFRDVINNINKSIFGSLVEDEDFKIQYVVLNPKKPKDLITTFKEFDVLDFNTSTRNDRMVKQTIIEFLKKENDFLSGEPSIQTISKSSEIGEFIIDTNRIKTLSTVLSNSADARIIVDRLSFVLEIGSTIIKIKTKLQASRLQVTDKVQLFHEKFYDKLGGGKRKIAAIQSLAKDGLSVLMETEDLSNAFTRVSTITVSGASNFTNATDDDKVFNGFITDSFGLISNSESTFGLNLIW